MSDPRHGTIKTSDIADGFYWYLYSGPNEAWHPVSIDTDSFGRRVTATGDETAISLETALAEGTLGPRLEPPNVDPSTGDVHGDQKAQR